MAKITTVNVFTRYNLGGKYQNFYYNKKFTPFFRRYSCYLMGRRYKTFYECNVTQLRNSIDNLSTKPSLLREVKLKESLGYAQSNQTRHSALLC